MIDKKGIRGGKRPGAGRKPIKDPKKNKTLKLSVITHEYLKSISDKLGISQAIIIETLVKKLHQGEVEINKKTIE
ncbi:MAG: hypothetical protein QM478_11565 [Flavobacteriaceae bacterium]